MNRGVSLLETLVAISVFSMVFIAILTSIQFIYQSQEDQIKNIKTLAEMRRGIEYMVKYIRESKYSDIGDYPIQEFGPTTLTIYANVDSDPGVEKVKFYMYNGIIYMDVYKLAAYNSGYSPWPEYTYTLVRHVANSAEDPIFTYFDAAGNRITDYTKVLDVRHVKVKIKAGNMGKTSTTTYTLTSSATLRNLR